MRTWALDVLVPLLAFAPLLTVPVLDGLLFFTAAMYLSFKTSATMWCPQQPPHAGPKYAKLYRDIAAMVAQC